MIRSFLFALAVALSSAAPILAADPTIDEMAGQMIIVGFKGDSVGDPSVKAMVEAVRAGRVGGVMYLKYNVTSKAAVSAMNKAFKDAAPAGLPPFLTLDQEGGAVERLTKAIGFPEVPTAADVARAGPNAARNYYSDMAKGIAALGFTVNFGPVADLNVNPNNQIIAKFGRAFSADPATVAEYDRIFIDAHHKEGLLTALKHFPGHGSSTADSHEGFVDITKTWSDVELKPYQALFDAGYKDFVMVGHLYHQGYSEAGEELPASLTDRWIVSTLRMEMGFEGVVISDDLEMGAIRKRFSVKETIVKAVWAGMDVLLFSNTAAYDPQLGDEIRAILVSEAEADPAFAERIRQSFRRIQAMKSRIGQPITPLS